MSFRDALNRKRREARESAVRSRASAAEEASRREAFFVPVYRLADTMHQDGIRFASGRVPRGSSLRNAAQRANMGPQLMITIDERLTIVIRIVTDDDQNLLYDCMLQTRTPTIVGPRSAAERPLRTADMQQVTEWMAEVAAQYEVPADSEQSVGNRSQRGDPRRPRREASSPERLKPPERTRVIDLSEERDVSPNQEG